MHFAHSSLEFPFSSSCSSFNVLSSVPSLVIIVFQCSRNVILPENRTDDIQLCRPDSCSF